MDSPRSVTSDVSESRFRLPASIANASREELQKKLIDAFKKLKLRDKRLSELGKVAASEEAVGLKKQVAELKAEVYELRSEQGVGGDGDIAKDQIEGLKNEVGELTAANKQQGRDIETMQARLTNLESENTDLKTGSANAQRQLQDEVDKCEALEEQSGSLKSSLRDIAEERDIAVSKLSESKEQVAVLEDGLSAAQDRIRKLEEEVSCASSNAESDLEYYRKRVGDLESEMRTVKQDKDGIESQASRLRSELDALKIMCEKDSAEYAQSSMESDRKVQELQDEIKGLRSEMEQESDAERSLAKAVSRIAELEGEVAALKDSEDNSDGTVSRVYAKELEQQVEKYRTKCEELEASLGEGVAKCKVQMTEIGELKAQMQVLKSENERLSESETQSCNELAQRLAQIDDLRRIEAQLDSQLCSLEQRAEQAEGEVAEMEENLTAERETWNSERGDWEEQVRCLEETIVQMEQQGTSATVLADKTSDLEQTVAKLKEQLEASSKQQEALQQELSAKTAALKDMESEHSTESAKLRAENSKLSDSLTQSEQHLTAISSKLDRDIQVREGLESKMTALQTEAGRVSNLETEIASLKKSASQKEALKAEESASLTQKLESRTKECTTVQEKLTDAQQQVKDLKDRLDTATSEKEAVEAQLQDVRMQLEDESKQLSQSKESLDHEKDKMKKGFLELKKRLDRALNQQRKSELDCAELRGKFEAERDMLKAEMENCKAAVDQSSTELREYKLRAHTLLKNKDSELLQLRAEVESNSGAVSEAGILKEEMEAIAAEKDRQQAEMAAAEERFQHHLDDLTADFQLQLDRANADSLQFRSAADQAAQEMQEWQSKALKLEEMLAQAQEAASKDRLESPPRAVATHPVPSTNEVQDLQNHVNSLQDELRASKEAMEELCESKEAEVARLLQANADLKQKLSTPTSPTVSPRPSGQSSRVRNDSAMTESPPKFTDTFELATLINEKTDVASVASSSGGPEHPVEFVGESDDGHIVALAQKQAERDEALMTARRRNEQLEAEILELEGELKLREEQDKVLKQALRDADRVKEQQDRMLDKVDMEYLKNTVVKLLETGEAEALLPVLAKLLKLSGDEETNVLGSIKATKERIMKEAGQAASSGGLLSGLTGWSWGVQD